MKGQINAVGRQYLWCALAVGVGLMFAPGLVLAAPNGAHTDSFKNQSSQSETSRLLQSIRNQADVVHRNARQIKELINNGAMTGWQEDAWNLDDTHHEVNVMDRTVRRLEAMRSEFPPQERGAINDVAAKTYELTGYVQGAIRNLDRNKEIIHTLDPEYVHDIDQISRRAGTIASLTDHLNG